MTGQVERLVDGGERRDVVGELIGEHDLQQLRDAVEHVRPPGGPRGRRGGVQADHDYAVGAQRERRLQWRVEAHATVAVPARRCARLADLDRRECARDRRRREHMLGFEHGGDVVDRARHVGLERRAAVMEDDAARGRVSRRDDGGGRQRAVLDVVLDPLERRPVARACPRSGEVSSSPDGSARGKWASIAAVPTRRRSSDGDVNGRSALPQRSSRHMSSAAAAAASSGSWARAAKNEPLSAPMLVPTRMSGVCSARPAPAPARP